MLINYTGESKVIGRICELINTMTGVNFEVVQTLPTTDISTSTIYLVPKSDPGAENIYDEYINTDGTSAGWELIGDTEIDLSDYYTKTETDDLLDEKADIGDIPDELADLADDSTHRLVTDTEKTTWNGKADTDENVKQIFTDNQNSNFYILGSNSDSQGDETNPVKKLAHAYFNGNSGNLTIRRKHTSQNLVNNTVSIGNDTPEGTSGNVDGILRLYGKGAYYFQLYDGYNSLSANQTYRPRNRTGALALLPDAAEYAAAAELDDFNIINPPYYHANGSYNDGNLVYTSNEDTGDYTVTGVDTANRALNLKRYSQGLYLTPGTYRMSGCPSGGSSSTYSIRVYSSTEAGTTTGIGNDYGSGLEFTLAERTLIHIVFYVNANNNINVTFRPTLTKVAKYDWRSNNVLGAKNLNNYPYQEATHTDTGIIYTDNGDGTIKAEGKSISSSRSGFVCHSRAAGSANSFFLKNGTYILTGCPAGGSEQSFYIEVGRTLNGVLTRYGRETGAGLIFTVNGDDNNTDGAQIQLVCYCVGNYQLPTAGIIFKPMIRLASDTETEWQPYTMTNQELTEILKRSVPRTAGTYTLQATVDSNGGLVLNWV